jgi:mevalonate kinase
MDLLRQAAEKINPVTFPSGGIVAPQPPKIGVAQMQTGEMVINREQVARLTHAIDINQMDSVSATISSENLSDVLQRMRERAIETTG